MERFKSQGQTQRFVATYGAIYNNFKIERHLTPERQCAASELPPWKSGLPRALLPHESAGSGFRAI